MMKGILLLVLSLALLPSGAFASVESLMIVEIQIAGDKLDQDFVKIYNPTDSDIYLANYRDSYVRLVKRTKTANKDISIKSWSQEPDAKIPSRGYYIWASSKDKSYPATINADAFTAQYLTDDNGIALRLGPLDTGEIIDAVGWGDFNNVLFKGTAFPQNPETNQRLVRKQSNSVYQNTNDNANDFYLNPPSQVASELQPEPQPQSQPEPQPQSQPESPPQENTPPANSSYDNDLTGQSTGNESAPVQTSVQYPDGIFVNEILPYPEGSNAEEEWIEIFNNNNFMADLSDWKIQDTAGSVKTYIFPAGTSIGPNGFLVLLRPITKIVLNNDGDGLQLFWPDGKVVHKVSFGKAPKNQSYNRTPSGWFWSATLTPGSANIVPTAKRTEENESTIDSAKKAVVDINTAPLEDLVKIAHIGETRAQELISLRPFYSLDDLTRIKGIGDKAIEDIKKQGLAWVDPELEHEKIKEDTEALAALAEPIKQEGSDRRIPSGLIVFLAASAIAIFSGMAIILLKKKLTEIRPL